MWSVIDSKQHQSYQWARQWGRLDSFATDATIRYQIWVTSLTAGKHAHPQQIDSPGQLDLRRAQKSWEHFFLASLLRIDQLGSIPRQLFSAMPTGLIYLPDSSFRPDQSVRLCLYSTKAWLSSIKNRSTQYPQQAQRLRCHLANAVFYSALVRVSFQKMVGNSIILPSFVRDSSCRLAKLLVLVSKNNFGSVSQVIFRVDQKLVACAGKWKSNVCE